MDLFRGRDSLRYPGEGLAFVLTLIFALPAASAIGFFIHEEIGIAQVALFAVIAMVYVTLGRGRLIGSSVRIHETQYPEVFAVVKRAAASLGVPVPLVFVRDDAFVPAVALGLGEPYSLVLSSHWIEDFQEDELAFVIGRELGHIAAGHTRITSLLSVNGNENAIVALIFGAWLRKIELTCDRAGLLCCGSLDGATRAVVIATFRHFGRRVDHRVFAEQHKELETDGMLRMGEWIGAMPYATRRIEAMRQFIESPRCRELEPRFRLGEAYPAALVPAAPRGAHVTPRDCPNLWRRAGVWLIDFIVILTITQTLSASVSIGGTPHGHASALDMAVKQSIEIGHTRAFDLRSGGIIAGSIPISWETMRQMAVGNMFFWLWIYSSILVATAGQTLGMMILGARVVRADFSRPRLAQILWRYALAWFPPTMGVIMIIGIFRRVNLHDKFSGTRLVRSERALAPA